MFSGVASSAAGSAYGAAREALVDAAIKARKLGFCRVLFLGNFNRLVQRVCNTESTPLEGEDYVCRSSFPSAEWTSLQVVFLVPKVVPGSVCHLADTPTRMPIHQSWSNPALFVSLTFTCSLSPFYGKKHKHYNLVRNK